MHYKLVTKCRLRAVTGCTRSKCHFEFNVQSNNSEIVTPEVSFNIVNNGYMHLENFTYSLACIPFSGSNY